MIAGRLCSIPEPGAQPGGEESEEAWGGGSGKPGGGREEVNVQVVAGSQPAVEHQHSQSLAELWQDKPREDGFLKRAGRRLRISIYGRDQRESYYLDSMIGPDPALTMAAKSCSAASRRPGLPRRRRLLPSLWQEALCGLFDSLSWNIFILLVTIFAVFAPDIVIICSAPDSVNAWMNSFLVAAMAVFAGETLLDFLSRPAVHWLRLALDIISNLSVLFAITWFTEAVGARTDGTTSDAARACRIVRLVRIVSVLEILGWRMKQRYHRNNPEAGAELADQLAPSNIGKKIGEIATLQVATVVIATVVCTTLIIGADINTGSSQGLQAFAASLAAMAAAGATAVQASRHPTFTRLLVHPAGLQLQPTIDAMLTFSSDQLEGQQVPMVLDVAGVGYWNWVVQNGGWTARSTDRETLVDGAVNLQINVAKENHLRAGLNMALAGAVMLLLLAFVVLLNRTIWRMLVQPLDRIFLSICTNAAQVMAALGSPEDEAPRGGGSGGRGSKKDSLDIVTIEAAVNKMGRILEQYTSTGGVGLNAVKKMATNADQSTKEWLATMVAGPGSEEVVSGRRPSDPAPSGGGAAAGAKGRTARLASPSSHSPSQGAPLRLAYGRGGRGAGSGGGPGQQRRSRLSRMSEAQLPGQAGLLALGALEAERSDRERQRRSSLAQFQASRTSSAESALSGGSEEQAAAGGSARADPGSPRPPPQQEQAVQPPDDAAGQRAPGSPRPAAQSGLQHVGSPAPPTGSQQQQQQASGSRGSSGSPTLGLLASSSSASSDAAALSAAAAARAPGWVAPSEAWAQLGGSSLAESEKQLLANVDVDYLHSFGFDALGIPRPLLPAYACAMFLELDLAFFGGADAAVIEEPAPQGRGGFVDVATLWRFVGEVAATYQRVPYHNFQHCVDVTHTTFMFIKRVAHKVALSELEKFALMVAALSHDLDHPGVNNAFLVNARDALATTYNDSSVLENRHVACLYSLLLSKPQLNIFARLEPQQWREVRKMVIGAVLATDMVHHFPMVSRLEVFYELHAAAIQAHHRALRQGAARDHLPRLFDSAEERQLLLNLLLHCADISNPVKPAAIAENWADRVLAEFFAQGDRERAARLPISPMCDRDKTSRAGSQINFIEFVVAPIYVQVYKIFPELGELLDNLIANRHFWQDALSAELAAEDLAAAERSSSGSGAGGAAGRPPKAGSDGLSRTAEQRAEELGKADKRLLDFQNKYRDILSRRRQQLVRLASTQSSKQSFFSPVQPQQSLPAPKPGSPSAARNGSLMSLVEAAAGAVGPAVAGGVERGSSTAAGLLGKLGLGRGLKRSNSRGGVAAPDPAPSDGASWRSSAASVGDGGVELAPSSSSGGCLGGHGGRVAPEDEAV